MNVEQLLNQYLLQLVSNGTILTGDLVGVYEAQFLGKAKATFLVNGEIKEKLIVVRNVSDVYSWYFLYPADQNDIKKEPGDWSYPEYVKRIVAPITLIMDDIGVKIYSWFQLNNLPVVTVDDKVYLYCASILPEHQYVIDMYKGVIIVEDRDTTTTTTTII